MHDFDVHQESRAGACRGFLCAEDLTTASELPGGFQREAGGSSTPWISPVPTPGSYYQILRGDNLLQIAARAYPSEDPYAGARRINGSARNKKFVWKGARDNLFPQGRISFSPRYTCSSAAQHSAVDAVLGGHCFAAIWIPPKITHFHPLLGPLLPLDARGDEDDVEFEGGLPTTQGSGRPAGSPGALRSVFDTTVPPYRWVCRLWMTMRYGNDVRRGQGSAVLLFPGYVLTAAHCVRYVVYGRDGSDQMGRAESISVTPALNTAAKLGRRRPFGSAKVVDCRYLSAYDAALEKGVFRPSLDYALLKLDRPIGNQRFPNVDDKPLGAWPWVITSLALDDVHGRTVNMAGYPGEGRGRQRTATGPARAGLRDNAQYVLKEGVNTLEWSPVPEHRLLEYLVEDQVGSSWEGMSGGPIWMKEPRQRRLVGLHSQRLRILDGDGRPRDLRQGPLITAELMADVEDWFASMGPPW